MNGKTQRKFGEQYAKLEIAKDYYKQIYLTDISAVDGVKRNPEWARSLMWSYARNMATKAKKSKIFADVKATQNVSDVTLDSYVKKLEELFVIKDIDAWTPQIRSKTAIRSGKKHNEEASKNPEHPRAKYREPSALIVISATAAMGYTTDNGVKIVPIGCLKD